MILKDTATFQVLFVVSLRASLLWRSTVAFTYLKVKSFKCLGLLLVVLVMVLRIWSCLHHCPIIYVRNQYEKQQPIFAW